MPLTGKQLLDRLAEMEGTAFTAWTEPAKRVRVGQINLALRREWKADDPLFAFPETVDSDTVDVTNGLIDPADLGDQTWCALFESDPRAAGALFRPVKAHLSHEGVHPTRSMSSVFAFFRKAVPQLTYAEGGNYSTPNDIPDIFVDTVPLRALAAIYVSLQQFDALNAMLKLYGEPGKLREARMEALRNSGLVWDGYAMALTPAAA